LVYFKDYKIYISFNTDNFKQIIEIKEKNSIEPLALLKYKKDSFLFVTENYIVIFTETAHGFEEDYIISGVFSSDCQILDDTLFVIYKNKLTSYNLVTDTLKSAKNFTFVNENDIDFCKNTIYSDHALYDLFTYQKLLDFPHNIVFVDDNIIVSTNKIFILSKDNYTINQEIEEKCTCMKKFASTFVIGFENYIIQFQKLPNDDKYIYYDCYVFSESNKVLNIYKDSIHLNDRVVQIPFSAL